MQKTQTHELEQDFSYVNFFKSSWKNILIICACAIFYSFGTVMFLTKSASIPSGLSAISITISLVFVSTKKYLTLIYLALNIPLFIIFWKKVSKKFMLFTIIFLMCNALFGFIFSLQPIEHFFYENMFVILPNSKGNNIGLEMINGQTRIVEEGWPVFIYVILALTFIGPSAAIVWKQGASTGGTDIVAHYISTIKKKDVGLFLMMIGYIVASCALVIIWCLKSWGPNDIKNQINGFKSLIGVQTISSFTFIFLNGNIINILYPKYKKIKLKIDTTQHEKIIDYFKEINFWHPYKIDESISGYTKKKQYSIETIVLLLEADQLVYQLKQIDPKSWISISPVSKIYGRFNYSKLE